MANRAGGDQGGQLGRRRQAGENVFGMIELDTVPRAAILGETRVKSGCYEDSCPKNRWKFRNNLKDDPGETRDLAATHQAIVAKIEKIMRAQHAPSAESPFPALDQLPAQGARAGGRE